MHSVPDASPRGELLAGFRKVVPVLLGTMPFGFVTGVAAAAAGMSAAQGIALSVFGFSGIAQLITAQLVAVHSPIVVTVAAAFVVSLRFLMYSAAMAPHLAHLDRRWRAGLAFMMSDQSFAAAAHRYAEPGEIGHRHWFFLGSAATLYVSWQVAVALGVLVGGRVPASWSLDFAVVLTFIALLVPVLRTRAELAAAVVSAAIALIAAGLPYRLSLVVASLGGIAAGLAVEAWRRR